MVTLILLKFLIWKFYNVVIFLDMLQLFVLMTAIILRWLLGVVEMRMVLVKV